MINELTLYTGVDIPLNSAKLVIHQPTLKEIGIMGEINFFQIIKFLTTDKSEFNIHKELIDKSTNLQVVTQIINIKDDEQIKEIKNNLLMFLTIIFNKYEINITDSAFEIKQNNNLICTFTDEIYEEFVDIIRQMYLIEDKRKTVSKDKATQRILDKLNKRHLKLEKMKENKGENVKDNESQIVKLINILSTGKNLDSNEIFNYTYYQLVKDYTRMINKINYDMINSIRIAGGKIDEEPVNWML